MGVKLINWDDSRTKLEVQKRFQNASQARIYQEERWIRNEKAVYSTTSSMTMGSNLEASFGASGQSDVDGSDADMNVAYTFKNFRFIHAQMSANPPSVVMRPTSSDQEDHRKADAADRVVRWALRHYSMQEKVDQLSLHTLLYGTGVIKAVWDSTRGDIIDYDKVKGEMTLEGDIAITAPFVWNIYLDPDAKTVDEIKWVLERVYIDYEEACLRWPDKSDELKKARIEKKGTSSSNNGRDSQLQNDRYNCVELLEYWETGLPTNGYMGRFAMANTEGDVIEPCRPSPHRFKRAGAIAKIEAMDISDAEKEIRTERIPEQARLPYHILTDVDMPNMAWGRSNIEYVAALQDTLNRLDSSRLDNLQAHSVARIIVPESAEVADDGLSNSPWDVTKIAGNQPPYFMSAPAVMPDQSMFRQDLVQGINDVFGVNESMFGNQSREQAAAAMQYATNQGNMIRRRLFNKYVLVVESIYGHGILSLIRKHWTLGRTIAVLGKEKALESIDLKGADIDGGYDVVGEYGVSLSLDPVTRRQEIMTMQPMFEKAGVPARTSLRMMKLSELEGLYDKLDLAGARQKEIFDVMIATGVYIAPKKYRDHANMIAWALDYFMTSEYEMLPEEIQQLCERHNEERAMLAAQESPGSSNPASPPAAPGPVPDPAPPGPTTDQPGPVPAA